MIFSKNNIRFVLGGVLALFIIGAHAAPNHSKPTTLVKHIASFGAYAVVNYNKDVNNLFDHGSGCFPTGDYALDNQDKIRTFLIDYSTAEGKSNYVLVMAAAAARKKTSFIVTSCDSTFGTGLPVVERVETIF